MQPANSQTTWNGIYIDSSSAETKISHMGPLSVSCSEYAQAVLGQSQGR